MTSEFKSWKDIMHWLEDNGFEKLSKRMKINNDCWNSSGEFGRSQVHICDSLRFCKSEEERIEIANQLQSEEDLIDELKQIQ